MTMASICGCYMFFNIYFEHFFFFSRDEWEIVDGIFSWQRLNVGNGSNVDEGWWYLQGRKMRVGKRERETLHSWSCFTTRQRIFDDLAVSTSHPPKNQGRVTEWSRAAEKSRPIYTHSSTAPLTLERLLHAALYGLSSDSTTSIYSSLYDVEKEWDDQLTCHIWRHSSVCQTLNPLFVFLQEFVRRIKIFSNGYFFFFLFAHWHCLTTFHTSMATWCYLFSWNWIPWSRVLVYYILIRRVRTAIDRTTTQTVSRKRTYPIPLEKKKIWPSLSASGYCPLVLYSFIVG